MTITEWFTTITHVIYGRLLTVTRDERGSGENASVVLWFVAAGVGVAVIAGIIYAAVKSEASKPLTPPAAP